MPSALELLGEIPKKSSAIDLLSDEPTTSSAIDLLKPEVEEPAVAPTTEQPTVTPEDFYTKEQLPGFAGYSGRFGFGPKPEGGWSEEGVPLNKEGKPYIEPQRATGYIAETLKGLSTLASHPMETVRGGLDFALSIPGFLTGLVNAAGRASKTFADQVANDLDFNLEDIYNEASKGMLQGMEFFEPGKKKIVGEPTEESQLATQVLMAPLSTLSALGHGAADYEGFRNYPNIRGAYRFLGDITGLMTMGLILHGGARGEFAKSVEDVAVEGKRIMDAEKQIDLIPNEVIKQAQKKVLEVEKVQLELKAKAAADQLGGDALIREELGRQAEGIARAKQIKPESIVPEYLEDAKKAAKRKVKTGIELLEEPTKEIETKLGVKYDGEQPIPDKPSLHLWTDQETKSTFSTKGTSVEEVRSRLEETRSKFEQLTDIDEQSGTEIPELKGDKSPFFQNPEETKIFKNQYGQREKAVMSDPELLTQKLINDVNRWYHGEELDIDSVRENLSMLAARADELRMDYFISGVDHFQWKEVVSEAASWARGMERTEKPKGTKLYTGIPLDEAAKKLVEGAKKLSEYTKAARGMKAFKPAEAAKLVKEELMRSFVDRSGNIRQELLDKLGQEGYEVLQSMYLAKGSSSIAANMLKQMRKEVYGGLSKAEKNILDNLILADRMTDIGKYKTTKQFKFPEGLDPVNAAAYNELFEYTEGLKPDRAEVLRQRAKAYFDWMKRPLKDMLDAGLISQNEYDALASHNYRRIKLVDIYDQRYKAKVGKKSRTVYDSGIESLARGRDTDIYEPSSQIMALEVFNRAYGRVMNNLANLELLKLARRDPTNPFVRVKEGKQDRIPSGWNRIFVYEDGTRKPIYLSPEMSKEWIISSPETSYRLSQFLRYASGSPVLRTFATGINWGFALANLPRDIMHTWFASRVYENGQWRSLHSPYLPVFALRMAKDQATVFSDALLRKGRYEDYLKEGGGMEFMVHQGRLFRHGRHLEGPVDRIFDFLGYFGETSEIMTRLAIRERAVRQGKSPKEATFAARDYMDFGQGGGIAKALDNAFPYLNASIQGTRGLLRAFQPGSGTALVSTFKLAQFAALVSGVYIAATKQNPKTMESVKNDIDSQNNLIIPLGDEFGFEDSKGQTRYPYLKIPLDPGQKFFKKFFEASTDKWLGNEIDVDGTVNALEQISPVGVSSLPPVISGTLGYLTNKDFWLNEDIWRKTDKPFGWPESKEEYIPGRTPQAYIDLGAKTGLSPERTKYLVEELVTGGTIWSYLAGQGYDAAFGDLPKDMREKHLAEVLDKVPMVRRFFGVTNPYSEYAGKIEDAKEKSDIDRWIQNRGLDMRVEGYLYQGNVSRKEVVDYMKSFKDKDTYDRLKERFEFQEKIKDLPNRSFWLRLKGLTTEARAKVYVDRLESSTDEEREQLRKELATVIRAGGVVSKSFREEVSKLRQVK